MSKAMIKGETAVVSIKFPTTAAIIGAPTWALFDWNGNELLTGVASQNAEGVWSASITIPTTMPIPGGEGELTLEFVGAAGDGTRYIRSKAIVVVDTADQWRDFGMLYSVGAPAITDFVFFDAQPTTITMTLREGYGSAPIPVASVTTSPSLYDVVTTAGFGYKMVLPIASGLVTDMSGGLYPYQLVTEATFAQNSGRPPVTQIIPVQVVTPQLVTYMNTLKRFLDKARLDEIDPNLQWHDEELAHFVLEGVNLLNGMGDTTFWTVKQWPSTLLSHLWQAAAFIALNARFLAEGLNAFEFQGSNTQLSFNRRDVVQTKMDELNNLLNQHFPTAKSAAIRAFGKGNPPPGASLPALVAGNIGIIGIARSPNNNYTFFPMGYRPGTFWRY